MTMQDTVGVDIDLRKYYAWSTSRGVLCNQATTVLQLLGSLATSRPSTILLEVAGPVIYGKEKAALYNKMRWTIHNVFVASMVGNAAASCKNLTVLVSPSSRWKHGHDDKSLHRMLGLTGMNKHLREAQAMATMYQTTKHQADWVDWYGYFFGV